MVLAGALIIAVGGADGVALVDTSAEDPTNRLADGTVVLDRTDSTWAPSLGFPHPREVQVDGEFIVEAAAGSLPLTIRSRLLTLKVNGKSTFRLVARSIETGAQVEVLEGDASIKVIPRITANPTT